MVNKILNHENISNKDQTTLVSIWYKFLIKYLIENAVNSVNGLTGDVILNADNVLTPEQVEAVNSTITLEKLSNINNDITNINERIEELANKGLTFTGFVSNTEPLSSEYEIQKGNLWINATEMPLSFPVSSTQIKIWDGSKWSSSSEDYTPKDFEFFRNINDNEGYYWFGGQWKVMSTDMSTDYFKLNPTTGKWEIKDEVSITVSTPEKDDNSKKAVNSEWVKSITDEITNNIDTINNVNIGKLSANTEMIADNTEQELTPWIKTLSEKVNGVISTSSFDTKITNCLTKIPNDIKLELTDGTLTLKAGSKVYDAIGNTIDIIEDFSSNYGNPVKGLFVVVNKSTLETFFIPPQNMTSGTTAPSTPKNERQLWYDTNSKIIKMYAPNETTFTETSLPIAIVSSSGVDNQIISIDQVFNGFSYIGSTIFALPGVEGLGPNGFNEDGTLKNVKYTINSIKTASISYQGDFVLVANSDAINTPRNTTYIYDFLKNENFYLDSKAEDFIFGNMSTDSTGRITSFNAKNTFQVVDRNDTEWASTQGKPSSRYEDLELKASGSEYIAPANGKFFIKLGSTETGQFITLALYSADGVYLSEQESIAVGAGNWVGGMYEIAKGQKYRIDYTANGQVYNVRFIYDEGAK